MKLLVAIFAGLMILDLVQTYFFPKYGLKEGNPFMAKLLTQYGFDELVFAKYVVFLMVFALAGSGVLGPPALWTVIGIQSSVVLWNAWKMSKGRQK